jgi:hypothetical protein
LCLNHVKMMNRSYFKKLLQNPKVKLYSFLVALLLWFYIVTENSYNHTVKVDLCLINQPSGWILTRAIPDKIKIQFRGSGRDLMALGSKKLHIDLDLEETIKDITFPISIEDIKGMSEGTSVEPLKVIEPMSVRVHLDQLHEKIIPIHSNIIFEFMDGYTQVGVVELEPDSVKIYGPGAFVDAITEVYTDSVKYENILKEITGKVDITPPEMETISYSLKKVRFRCDVQRIGERFIADIPVRVTNVPRNQKVTVAPSTFSLKLQGGVKILSKLKKEDIIATIDFQHQRYRGKKIPATIQVPPGITFTDSKPSSFEIFIEQ